MSRTYDNWERLVAAVIKKQQLWQLFHQNSPSSSIGSTSSVDPVSLNGFRGKDKLKFKMELRKGAFWTVMLLRTELLDDVEFLDKGNKYVTKLLHNVRMTEQEFEQQMEVLGDCRHENVEVPRAYYFSSKPNPTLVVYDYHSQRSVSWMLHDGKGSHDLDWKCRHKIAIGAARGVAHILAQCGGKLAHGNIRSSNVFLNSEQYGCVSDFGFACVKAYPSRLHNALRHPPRLQYFKKPSQRRNIQNFGFMLLELLTGESPMDAKGCDKDQCLQTWVRSIESKEWTSKLFDRRLRRTICSQRDLIEMMLTEIPGFNPWARDSIMNLETLRATLRSYFHSMARVPTYYFPPQDLSEMIEMLHVAMKCLSIYPPKMSDVVFMLENSKSKLKLWPRNRL